MGNFPLSSLHKGFTSSRGSRGRPIKLFFMENTKSNGGKRKRDESLQVRDAECKFPLLEYFCR